MLIIEHQSNGKRIVKFKKDWSPNRIGKAYTPPRDTTMSRDMYKLQTALLETKNGKV
jgi:hypothetical protein